MNKERINEMNEAELALIEEYLDEMNIPRKTKAGALYSVYGRVHLLGERSERLVTALKEDHDFWECEKCGYFSPEGNICLNCRYDPTLIDEKEEVSGLS